MLTRVIEWSLSNRMVVVVGALLVAVAGLQSAYHLPIDAVPDLTNVQVVVLTNAGSLSPIEVEQFISYPIESAMGGLPRIEEIRSVSRFGISAVTVVFEEGTDIYWARQLVTERLAIARSRLPQEFQDPEIGPLATALGEILQFEVRSDSRPPMELRTILEWNVAPMLRQVRGVTEINVHGGYYKSFEVQPDPNRLTSYELSLDELFRAVEDNNASAGGGYIVHHDEQRFIRGQSLLKTPEEIGQIVIRRKAGEPPILVRDVADVRAAPLTRQGSVTRDGRGEVVTGMAMMLIGENSREVVERVKERIDEIQGTLPKDVVLEVTYDRAHLINRTLKTVLTNLGEGGALVIFVLLVMLGSFRAGVITALAIPLSMLFATNLMRFFGVSASLMSLGAIDFGLIVDSSVIMVENCIRRLSHTHDQRSREEVIRDAAVEVRGPTMFGELIIGVVYLPILMLEGSEGKLFRPMALTVLFALGGSLILSLTFMPAVASLVLPRRMTEEEILPVRWLKRLYRPLVTFAVYNPKLTIAAAVAAVAVSVPIALNLGAEFMPRLDEGDLLIEANRLPSASLEGAIELGTRVENALRKFPEVRTVFCKTGRPEIANDVMGVHQTDIWVLLHEPGDWPVPKSRDQLIEEMSSVLNHEVVGASFAFTQPIEMRVDELVAGVKADVAVLLFGDDLTILAETSKRIEQLLRKIPGAVDVKADFQANLSTLTIRPRQDALARYGIAAQAVLDVVTAIGGKDVGVVYEGRTRFPIVVRLPETWRADAKKLELLPISQPGGQLVPLRELADIQIEETPPSIEHEENRRRTFVAANVRGRDVAGFVAEARRAVAAQVKLPPGYEIRWGGDFENLQSASRRLAIITPIVLLLVFFLLHRSFGSARLAVLVFLSVPVAASGGVFALALRGMPFSISAGVGFIALFGVAVLNSLVWVSAAESLRRTFMEIHEVILETALVRLRPILMTALVASLGFLPMALSTTAGAEIQRPLATVVIGGLVTSTLLTTFVVPAIYPYFLGHDEEQAELGR